MNLVQGLKAIASPTRLRILELLGDPAVANAGFRQHGVVQRGATATALRRLLGLSQPALSEQMQKLLNTGLVEAQHVGRWVVYSRDEERIRQLRQTILEKLLPPATGTAASPVAGSD